MYNLDTSNPIVIYFLSLSNVNSGLSDPLGAAAEARDVLGADAVEDLFVLDAEDLAEMGLKVAQRKRLIRCICDESGDRAPCCDSLGR